MKTAISSIETVVLTPLGRLHASNTGPIEVQAEE